MVGCSDVGASEIYNNSGEMSTAESIELQTPITSSVTSESLEDDDDDDDDDNPSLTINAKFAIMIFYYQCRVLLCLQKAAVENFTLDN